MTVGPVSRILSVIADGTIIPLRRPLLNACSDLPGTSTHCWVLIRVSASSRHAPELPPDSSPIWSCSVWGLPCAAHYCPAGALLPHLFTLTSTPERAKPARPGDPAIKKPRSRQRYLFCGTFRRLALKPASRTLSGTLLCGVRTFLQPGLRPISDRPVRLSTSSLYAMFRVTLAARFYGLPGVDGRASF